MYEEEVGNSPARETRLELLRLGEDPSGNVSAVRPAFRAEPTRVRDSAVHHRLHSADAVFVVAFAPGVFVRLGKLLSAPDRAAEIGLQDEIAVRGEGLRRPIEAQQRRARRSAVRIQEERRLLGRIGINGVRQVTFDFRSLLTLPLRYS